MTVRRVRGRGDKRNAPNKWNRLYGKDARVASRRPAGAAVVRCRAAPAQRDAAVRGLRFLCVRLRRDRSSAQVALRRFQRSERCLRMEHFIPPIASGSSIVRFISSSSERGCGIADSFFARAKTVQRDKHVLSHQPSIWKPQHSINGTWESRQKNMPREVYCIHFPNQ